MKKRIFAAAALAGTMLLAGCGAEPAESVKAEKVTYLPSDSAMKSKMEQLGYQTAAMGDLEQSGYTIFTASNGKENVEEFEGVMVMRAADSEELQSRKEQNTGASAERSHILVLTNDPDYGNVLITGTDKGIKDAGIKIG